MKAAHAEEPFEDAIESAMLRSGWERGLAGHYDRELGLDTGEMFTFIGATQIDEWNELLRRRGVREEYRPGSLDQNSAVDVAMREFGKLVARQIDDRGALEVLRHGVKDQGVLIKLAFFRPSHTLAAGALDQYEQNRLTVVRQLGYSAKDPLKRLDVALFLNGIPVATAELKNQGTKSNVEDCKRQYRETRDPKELLFARRTLVHFAIDQDLVFLATRLAGEETRFLPFNLGSGGAGERGEAGNPPLPADAPPGTYRTSYLWEKVWQRDAWLELIGRFLHVADESIKKGRAPVSKRGDAHRKPLIFPRYHQWDVVRRLTGHAARNGAGENYLVMHSAGSGKSNSIAWLVHRLSSLHTPEDPREISAGGRAKGLEQNQLVFDKVIVMTDRLVLDKQLQDTIHQFDHVAGVVHRIDNDSAQLAEALTGAEARIIITTQQKFSFVQDKIADMPGRRYAIVVDEAHSSQSGSSADAVKKLLGQGEDDEQDVLTASASARGKHPNLSYFAFTATPKDKTLNLFGQRSPVTRKMEPFHTYSMRQAISEGFILDVLRKYSTYDTYFRLRNAAVDEPERTVDARKARAALVRAVKLNPAAVDQQAQIIVDHYREHIMPRLSGRAKAMVVTASRKQAVVLYQAIRSYVDKREFADCGALVAFSDTLSIDGIDYTEAKLNGFPPSQLPARFGYVKADDPHAATRDQAEYRILVVADKYQTGFDEPLLTAMYVDKKLDGVAAVQTLSRLNRVHPLKTQDDVWVLDFANDAESIQKAFKPYFEEANAEPADPNLLYVKERDVKGYQLLDDTEIAAFARVQAEAEQSGTTRQQIEQAHAQLIRLTDPARDRYDRLLETDLEAADGFRKSLDQFIRAYSYLSQIAGFADLDLEGLYRYGSFLANRIQPGSGGGVDIGPVDLTHLRIVRSGEGDAGVEPEGAVVLPAFSPEGGGSARDEEEVPLGQVIAEINDRFGWGLDTGDQIWYGQQVVALAENHAIQQAGLANDDIDKFGQVFDRHLRRVVGERAKANDTLVRRFFGEDPEFKEVFTHVARKQAYDLIRRPARREAEQRLRRRGNEPTEG
ncbi:type I restriction endonuclease subunit R [Actinomadura mexicana]|uniref:Type I restriction enzyme, R subunit n=1 Tax=Actinomadura mexicana TaxID=134959 RepID=A0A238Y6I4_9ACTN|nr:type I restriction endonuclease [Actinomadura mexicana]SNR66411.1 type I restriction enzyme, R subunit [Actinomadura mexicana]